MTESIFTSEDMQDDSAMDQTTAAEQKHLLEDTPCFAYDGFSERQRFTPYLATVVAITLLCPLQFGWNIGVINNPKDVITTCEEEETIGLGLPACIPMSNFVWGIVAGAFPLGGLFGGFIGGTLTKIIGRRSTLLYNNLFFIVAGLLMSFAMNTPMLVLGRLAVGMGAGMGTAVSPMYLAEIPPIRYRGAIGTMNQLAIVIGILLSQVVSMYMLTPIGWRISLALTIVPAMMQIILMSTCVESPRFLVFSGKIDQARVALRRLRGQVEVEDELEHLVVCHEKDRAQSAAALTYTELFSRKSLRKALIIAVAAQLSQQLSGINGVMQFSTSIFEKIVGKSEATPLTLGIGIVNLFMTLISVYLMDRAGRRILFLSSQVGMAVFSVVIALGIMYSVDTLSVVGVMLFVAFFAVGLGPIPWLIMPEIFPTYAIAPAASLGVTINWLANVLITFFFSPAYDALGPWVFIIFAGCSFALFVVIATFLPETKGKSVDEITRMLA